MPMGRRKADYLARCRHRVHGAQRWRKTEGYDDLWDRLVDLYRTKHFRQSLDNSDRIAVNLAFSTINVIAPSIAVNQPAITVNARHADKADEAVIVEAVTNYWWRTYEVRPECRRAVKDFLIVGFGWLKTGYRFVEEEEELSDADFEAEFGELATQADEYAAENPDLAGDLPTDEEIAASAPATRMRVVEDRPFVERVSFRDVFVDPEATSPEDMRWIAQRIVKDEEEVKKDKRYKASARKNLKPDGVVAEKYRAAEQKDGDPDVKRVTLWEYYDLAAGTMCVFAEGSDDFLVEPMDQPYEFGHPFVMLRNYEVPDTFYPMGELEAIEDLQQELNKTRSQTMNDRKRYARKYLYDPAAFSSRAVGDLQSARDNVFVAVNEGVPLNEAVLPLPQTPLDPQIYMASEQIESDINTITGVSEYQRGGEQEIRRTATEASIIQDAANARAADKLAIIEDTYARVARRLVQLAQQYLTEPQAAHIVGKNGDPVWFEFDRRMIQGEFEFEVEGGSTQPKNEMVRRQTATQLLQVLSPFMDPMLGIVNTTELLTYVLQFGFGIKDAAKFIGPGPMMQGVPGAAASPPQAEVEDPTIPPPEEGGGETIPPEILAQLQGQFGLNLGA